MDLGDRLFVSAMLFMIVPIGIILWVIALGVVGKVIGLW